MLVYNYDSEGVFTYAEECPLDPLENKLNPQTGPHYQYPANSTTVVPPEHSDTQQERWTGLEWLLEDKPTPPPTEMERLASLEVENKLLKAQSQALAERGEFIEDVIAEMAMDFLRMMTAIQLFIIYIILGKEGKIMMAMFFAQRVILGKTAFAEVPSTLKPGVAEVLLDSGLPELVPVEYGSTAA